MCNEPSPPNSIPFKKGRACDINVGGAVRLEQTSGSGSTQIYHAAAPFVDYAIDMVVKILSDRFPSVSRESIVSVAKDVVISCNQVFGEAESLEQQSNLDRAIEAKGQNAESVGRSNNPALQSRFKRTRSMDTVKQRTNTRIHLAEIPNCQCLYSTSKILELLNRSVAGRKPQIGSYTNMIFDTQTSSNTLQVFHRWLF